MPSSFEPLHVFLSCHSQAHIRSAWNFTNWVAQTLQAIASLGWAELERLGNFVYPASLSQIGASCKRMEAAPPSFQITVRLVTGTRMLMTRLNRGPWEPQWVQALAQGNLNFAREPGVGSVIFCKVRCVEPWQIQETGYYTA